MEGVIKPKGAKKLLEERVRHRRFQGDQGGFAEQRQEMTLNYLKSKDRNKSHPQKHLLNSERRKSVPSRLRRGWDSEDGEA